MLQFSCNNTVMWSCKIVFAWYSQVAFCANVHYIFEFRFHCATATQIFVICHTFDMIILQDYMASLTLKKKAFCFTKHKRFIFREQQTLTGLCRNLFDILRKNCMLPCLTLVNIVVSVLFVFRDNTVSYFWNDNFPLAFEFTYFSKIKAPMC